MKTQKVQVSIAFFSLIWVIILSILGYLQYYSTMKSMNDIFDKVTYLDDKIMHLQSGNSTQGKNTTDIQVLLNELLMLQKDQSSSLAVAQAQIMTHQNQIEELKAQDESKDTKISDIEEIILKYKKSQLIEISDLQNEIKLIQDQDLIFEKLNQQMNADIIALNSTITDQLSKQIMEFNSTLSQQIQSLNKDINTLNTTNTSQISDFKEIILKNKESQLIEIANLHNEIKLIQDSDLIFKNLNQQMNADIIALNSTIKDQFSKQIIQFNSTLSQQIQSMNKDINTLNTTNTSQIQLVDTKIKTLKSESSNFTSNVVQFQTSILQLDLLQNDQIGKLNTQVFQQKQYTSTLNSTIIYGPYFPNSYGINVVVENGFNTLQTSVPCIVTVEGKSIISLIATGRMYCDTCQARMTFVKDGVVFLPKFGEVWIGSQFIWKDWVPINYTQEFVVEKGTYEFKLAFQLVDVSNKVIHIEGVSFVAKYLRVY